MIGILAIWGMKQIRKVMKDAPEELIVEYMEHIEKQEYDAMYSHDRYRRKFLPQ